MNKAVEEAVKADEARNEARRLRIEVKKAKEKRDAKAAEVQRFVSARNVWPEDSDNYKAQNTQVENHRKLLEIYEEELRDIELACSKVNCSADERPAGPAQADDDKEQTMLPAVKPGEFETLTAEEDLGLPVWAYVAIGVGLLLLVGFLVWFFALRDSSSPSSSSSAPRPVTLSGGAEAPAF